MAAVRPVAEPPPRQGGRRALLAGLALLVLGACGPAIHAPPTSEPADRVVRVVSNGWHTGIVLARGDIAAGLLPEAADLPWARFLELGWGDADYYPEPRPGLALALAAALLPTPAVIHLVGHADAPVAVPDALEVLTLPVSTSGLDRLVRRLDAAFVREDGRAAEGETSALVPGALFYPAHGRFHLLNTCNTWTARQLRAAGVPVAASGVVTAEDLMARLRPLALPDPVASPEPAH